MSPKIAERGFRKSANTLRSEAVLRLKETGPSPKNALGRAKAMPHIPYP
ncbi:hypothetical protein SHLA_120c000030 [Shinella sp. DD12]|nr:hypothetical protein SHLA_120c000030 [Shinella sp. DD12]